MKNCTFYPLRPFFALYFFSRFVSSSTATNAPRVRHTHKSERNKTRSTRQQHNNHFLRSDRDRWPIVSLCSNNPLCLQHTFQKHNSNCIRKPNKVTITFGNLCCCRDTLVLFHLVPSKYTSVKDSFLHLDPTKDPRPDHFSSNSKNFIINLRQ